MTVLADEGDNLWRAGRACVCARVRACMSKPLHITRLRVKVANKHLVITYPLVVSSNSYVTSGRIWQCERVHVRVPACVCTRVFMLTSTFFKGNRPFGVSVLLNVSYVKGFGFEAVLLTPCCLISPFHTSSIKCLSLTFIVEL